MNQSRLNLFYIGINSSHKILLVSTTNSNSQKLYDGAIWLEPICTKPWIRVHCFTGGVFISL